MGVVSLGTKAAEHPTWGMFHMGQTPIPPSTEIIPLMAVPVPVIQVTLGDLIALGGFAVVVARFVWDIRKEKRRVK